MRGIFLTITLLLTLTSCDRIKRKGHQSFDKTKEAIAERKSNLSDKIIAHYDPYNPDTKFNKKRFSEFFKFQPTNDVKNIYCYADEMGIDHDYQFAFSCDTTTITKIVSNLNLKHGTLSDNYGSGLWHNFPWWDSARIKTLKPYFRKGEHETYWYLWFDTPKKKHITLSLTCKFYKMKFVAATILFLITFICFMVYLSGMHGHLMFRPHMTEDWVIWGIAVSSFLIGVILLVQAVNKLPLTRGQCCTTIIS